MKRVLLTGGTGSFGHAFTEIVKDNVEHLAVYSRGEMRQYEMSLEHPQSDDSPMRYFIGDVRDKERLFRAMEGCDTVIHAAALKHVPVCEYNPDEAIKTNVMGAQNVIECAIERGVERVVALSTDKAAAPVNLYGATKMCADKLFLAAEGTKGSHRTMFSVVRYGNVWGSNGSVVPRFRDLVYEGATELPVTHPDMTRFSMTLKDAVALVLAALEHMTGGEMYVAKAPSYRITDLVEAFGCTPEVIGIRPGEKLHEELLSSAEARDAKDLGGCFVVSTGDGSCTRYASDTNTEWLSVESLRGMI